MEGAHRKLGLEKSACRSGGIPYSRFGASSLKQQAFRNCYVYFHTQKSQISLFETSLSVKAQMCMPEEFRDGSRELFSVILDTEITNKTPLRQCIRMP